MLFSDRIFLTNRIRHCLFLPSRLSLDVKFLAVRHIGVAFPYKVRYQISALTIVITAYPQDAAPSESAIRIPTFFMDVRWIKE
jgi:hypothetical protein